MKDSPLKDVTRRQRSTHVSIPRRCRHKQKRKTRGDIVIDHPRHQVRLDVLRTRRTNRGQPRMGSKFQIGKAATRHAGETSVFFCCCRKTPRKRNHLVLEFNYLSLQINVIVTILFQAGYNFGSYEGQNQRRPYARVSRKIWFLCSPHH